MGHVWTWVESKVDDFFTESEKSSCCQSLLGSTDSSIDLDFSCWRKTEETAEELEESSSPEEDSQMESSDPLAWHSTSEEDQEEAGKFKQDVLLRFLTEVTHLMEPLCISNTLLSQSPQDICSTGEQKGNGVLAHIDARGSPILKEEELKEECPLQVLKEQTGEKSPQGKEKWALQMLEEEPLMRWGTKKTEEFQDLCEEAGETQDSKFKVLERNSEKELHVLVESTGETGQDEVNSTELMNQASFNWRTLKEEVPQTLEEMDVGNSEEQLEDWNDSDFHLSYSNDDFSPCEISTTSSPSTSTVSLPLVHMSQDDPLAQRLLFKKTLLSIWKMVAGHRYSGPFLKPVSEKQAPGYKDVVKRPVDLSSIKKSLSKGLIQNMVQFQHDLMLMFQNAVMYNSSNHHIHRIAVEMQQEVLEQLQMLGEALLCSEEMRAFVRRC
ncbi:bromodomain-containing protein 8-like [Sphaerodactylus townsendi]|uniref:bromodomain-containing protein 8-like n=1 Tax=Sphaerodactylus townsendi TaxID=933632 RepID=UPI0020270266|nr:bromodomain-containing protein 8-like [Sphaerodactylus townsendi]